MRGDVAAVRALVAKKADVNAPQNDGSTALHWAVHRGNMELINLLIRGRRQRRRPPSAKAARRCGWPASTATPRSWARCSRRGADAEREAAARAHAADDCVANRQRGRDDGAARQGRRLERQGNAARHDAADVGGRRRRTRRPSSCWSSAAPISRRARTRRLAAAGPALGKANDPRKQVAAQGAALAAGRALDLGRAEPARRRPAASVAAAAAAGRAAAAALAGARRRRGERHGVRPGRRRRRGRHRPQSQPSRPTAAS